MKPSYEKIHRAFPQIDELFLKNHLASLPDGYFERFSEKELMVHITFLSGLSPQHPVKVQIHPHDKKNVDCTVCAFDYPSEFSLITGVLAAVGFSIISGDIFTYARSTSSAKPSYRTRRESHIKQQKQLLSRRRRIIDYFRGTIHSPLSLEKWAEEFQEKLESIILLLEQNNEKSRTEAKQKVNEMVAQRLVEINVDEHSLLYPVHMEIDNDNTRYTRLKVLSQDTPAFLYALSNALSLFKINIEHVRIQTISGRIEDILDVVNFTGKKITNPDKLNQIILSVLLTKQFTYFLGRSPDTYAALCRFEYLVEEILKLPERKKWIASLSDPYTLQSLAKLLGVSNFLWEDFIRLNYETLLPMLTPHLEGELLSLSQEKLSEALAKIIGDSDSFEVKQQRINAFKDREIFLIDLDYIFKRLDFHEFSEKLTCLAEYIVNSAVQCVYSKLKDHYGEPKTVGGLKAQCALFGLGKMGGAALGYASDIELLFIYSDNGYTIGPEVIENSEFFHLLAQETAQFIQAKQEGIFHIDLRLRPFGESGPLCSSLETFCYYYGPGGPAHSYERLALVRLRALGGDTALGAQIERLRDKFIYNVKNINLQEIRELRKKQFIEKTKGGKVNVKFSPGALVDLEYDVQILQIIHGTTIPRLRTPRIHKALKALSRADVLSPAETQELIAAYDFLRCLINGLRMLRGSAKDLFLPPPQSIEFKHLARRMGYEKHHALDPSQQLYLDFETHTAVVRAFVERHFGRDSLPGPATGSVIDLIISESIPAELKKKILSDIGFNNIERAAFNLKKLAGTGERRDTFIKLAILACDILSNKPDPDMALNNWERFVSSHPHHIIGNYKQLLSQPIRLEILLSMFSGSQFLSDTLIRYPEFFIWVTTPENLHKPPKRENLEHELRINEKEYTDHHAWLNYIRRFRRREILRIGARDIWLDAPLQEIMLDISLLAEAIVQVVLQNVWERVLKDTEIKNFCILAFGKLGGSELNYSSDIDLIGIYDDSPLPATSCTGKYRSHKELFTHIMEHVCADLALHTEEGYMYRVDLRLRPYGIGGELVSSITALTTYYTNDASLWEIQAALKLRPIAGNRALGSDFLAAIKPIFQTQRTHAVIADTIEKLRQRVTMQHTKQRTKNRGNVIDVKNGRGGIRDIEFLTQGLQLLFIPRYPALLNNNTLTTIELLREAQCLSEKHVAQLKEDYIFLRKVEHYLQILEDRQIHTLPQNSEELLALTKRVLGIKATVGDFMKRLDECFRRTRSIYESYLLKDNKIHFDDE
ncbi:MAG: glutamate-ammonia-ligase adenylyltransferase [bacterium]